MTEAEILAEIRRLDREKQNATNDYTKAQCDLEISRLCDERRSPKWQKRAVV